MDNNKLCNSYHAHNGIYGINQLSYTLFCTAVKPNQNDCLILKDIFKYFSRQKMFITLVCLILIKICSWRSNRRYVIISSSDGLAQNRSHPLPEQWWHCPAILIYASRPEWVNNEMEIQCVYCWGRGNIRRYRLFHIPDLLSSGTCHCHQGWTNETVYRTYGHNTFLPIAAELNIMGCVCELNSRVIIMISCIILLAIAVLCCYWPTGRLAILWLMCF